MRIQNTIESKLRQSLAPVHLEVINESHMHAVPPGSESHFKVVVVAEPFEGASLVKRHKRINAILADELAGEIHALAMQALTPDEWAARGGVTATSPECLGGGKVEPASG